MRIVFLGAPGSGKGTQAQRLMAEHHIPQVSTGDLLRESVAAGSELGRRAKAAMDAGELVSDDIVLGIIRERLQQDDAAAGFVLDGFPRNLAQATALEGVLAGIGRPLDAAVLIDVDFDILMKRLTGRRTCSVTGKLLNIHFSPKSELDACLKAGVSSCSVLTTMKKRSATGSRYTVPRPSRWSSITGPPDCSARSTARAAWTRSISGYNRRSRPEPSGRPVSGRPECREQRLTDH